LLSLLAVPSAQAQTYTVLHDFTGGDDGGFPIAGVIRDAQGNVYGTTYNGGAFGYGVVFKLDRAGKETVLHTFTGADGIWPAAALIRDSEGNLYGTTFDGGVFGGGKCHHGCGTVFKVDTTDKQTVLYAFTGGTDGENPAAGLVRDTDGDLLRHGQHWRRSILQVLCARMWSGVQVGQRRQGDGASRVHGCGWR